MRLQNNQKSIDGSTQPGETFRNIQYMFSLWLQTLSPRKGEETLQVHLNIKRKNEARMDCFETDCKNKEKEYCEGMAHNRVLCKQCDYFSSTKRTMNHHIRTIHEGVLLSCSQCDFKSATKQSLNVHTAFNHDGEVFSCSECDHKSRSKKALETHKITRHGDKIYECDECQYRRALLSELKRHKRKQHHNLKIKQENRTRYCFNKNNNSF